MTVKEMGVLNVVTGKSALTMFCGKQPVEGDKLFERFISCLWPLLSGLVS
jgi:hypothetical protein